MDASDRSADCAPVAALLHEAEGLPALKDILLGPEQGLQYFVSHAPEATEGWAEVLSNGLTFDLRGLREGQAISAPDIASAVGLALPGPAQSRWLTVAPGPHLAGAEHLLPVIRVVSTLLMELAKVGPAKGIAWLPARLIIKTELFERAVRPWLEGGAFPAPAFVAMHRETDGSLRTEGLNFLIGQEFLLRPGASGDLKQLPFVALRLVDWLIANGPVMESARAVLAGTGAVSLEAQGGERILARCD
ncbi:hypothetical protein [Novosphingobium taihuense]|uniref:Uncharacterized protein n=1 Tax=Novosphingobium taihuense TaxID=260085 RepID=A0A7W7A8Z0_9SPHN|nr:hypothetical protein [Novosphingobium taihuense]MBB4612608.1 hypothetical protein [Novosphingobium taihuense]TWH88040.1 hypothetical protein IQ25_00154 [Novosphingobium taihuense]